MDRLSKHRIGPPPWKLCCRMLLLLPLMPGVLAADDAAPASSTSPVEATDTLTPEDHVAATDAAGKQPATSSDASLPAENTDPPKPSPAALFAELMSEPSQVYRSADDHLTWLPGSGDQLGWTTWGGDAYLPRSDTDGFQTWLNIHWLSGPSFTPLPARLYDLGVAWQQRGTWLPRLKYDLHASIGVWSDFEDSARDGVRFPGHAVGMYSLGQSADLVFGLEVLDRDDLSVLPVLGLSLRHDDLPRLRLDLVFPRPRISWQVSDTSRTYLAGKLDGGTWDTEGDRVVTYSDIRVVWGMEHQQSDGSLSVWEIGYVFDRTLEFRGTQGETSLDQSFMLS